MCGFVGTIASQPIGDDTRHAIVPLTALLERRGPDDQGLWNGEYALLGFRRLAVIDVSEAGHQPMVSPGGRWVLVFNGEIYNFADLRSELQSDGIQFRSASDTEVVLHALTHWGSDALTRFNGMFALALYDTETRSVLLARDPMGIKPLYWLTHPKGIVFSSQYDAVIRHPWCERQRLRPDVAALYLQYGYVPSPYGIVENTGQLTPGSTATWTADRGMVVGEFARWPDRPDHYLNPTEAAELVHSAVRNAVRRQLVSDVPVGTFLSGGIDSPLVTAVSRSELGRPVPSFTIGSESPEFDETDQARLYGDHLGIEHSIRTITAADALAMVDDVFDAFGEPFGDYSAFPTMLVSRLAREHATVALSGDGGDELFFGYPRTWTLLKWRQFFKLPVPARRAARRAVIPLGRWTPPGATTYGPLGTMYGIAHTEFGGATLGQVAPGLGAPPEDFRLYDLDKVPSADELAQWARRVEVMGHLEKMLIKVDRASMHESLEVRVPLLDLDLVRASTAIDPALCMANGIGKVPLRRELGRYIPESMMSRPKRGFGVPLGDWLRGDLADRFTERVLEHPTILADAFDFQVVRDIVDQHRRGADFTQQLWNLLTLQEWAARHLRPV